MFVKRKGCSMKQMAYAKRVFGAQGTTKKEIALDVGYSPNVANSISSHIENKPGFNNAMAALAIDSNNLALAAMSEFKARGFADFSNKDLIGALNAIGSAWSRFNVVKPTKDDHPGNNKLRTVILQQIENQTVYPGKEVAPIKKPPVVVAEVVKEGEKLDF
jgi:hypothetical protein